MNAAEPLADRLRPKSLETFSGQHHLLSQGKPLYEAIATGQLHSFILWGPPGVGKTTLAKIIAQKADANFIALSAVLSGVKDIRNVVEEAKKIVLNFKKIPSFLLMKFIVLISHNKMLFYLTSRRVFLPLLEQRRKTPLFHLIMRFYRERACIR
jgi:ATPase related to the helicase subunit of the Holliday junction resolvase